MVRWIKTLLALLPVMQLVDLLCDYLGELAKKTDNTLDDDAVQIIRTVLTTAFANKAV